MSFKEIMNFLNKCLFFPAKIEDKLLINIGEFLSGGKFKFFNVKRRFSRGFVGNKNSGIPQCPKPTFFENVKSLVCWNRAKRLHEYVDERHRILGPIFKMQIGPVTAIFVNSPEYYRRIFKLEGSTPQNFTPEAWRLYNGMRKCPRGLLFMNGEEWLHFRRIMNKLLLSPYTANNIVTNSCENAAIKLCNEWKFYADSKKSLPELEMKLYRWSIEVMMSTLMGSAWENHEKKISNDIKILAKNLHQIFIQSAKLSLLPSKLTMKLRLPVWNKFVNVTDEVLRIVRKLVIEMEQLSDNGLLNLMKNEGIRDENLIRIVTDLIIAAGDTTAFSTQWALYLLSTHEEVQEKLLKISASKDSKEIINDSYVKGILRESLRLYPTAPFLLRILPQDSQIGGYTISRGEMVIMSLYSSGRDENNFPDANKFLPERWTRNDEKKYENISNPFGSIPFALGARSCVGKKFAETQMILALTQITKNFKIECENAENIRMTLHLISVPSEPIKLQLRRRKNSNLIK